VQLRLHNTLTRRVEPLVPLNEGEIRMYTCGPTVYRPVHVGNLRSYLFADWLRRAFELFGHRVVSVKNITDVGHMRQDAVDRGEDKVIAAALAAGRTPSEIAQFYEAAFREDERRLGILPATEYPRATAHVPEMIALIEELLKKELAYVVDGTVYYAVKRFEGYGRLSGNVAEALRQGVRSEADPNKRNAADFALWKHAEPERRALVWSSPWGRGYPGWHIECSAMSTKYLGERFDVHTGGVDNIFPHHEDEIAQSEGAFGHSVVSMWVHGQHLLADGVKMAKSARNTVEVHEIEARGIDPLAFRYQCLLTHYRARMHFSVAALRQAAEGLDHLRQRVRALAQHSDPARTPPRLPERVSTAFSDVARERWNELFRERLADDLDLPGALALVQACVADPDIPPTARLQFACDADVVLGLDLASVARERADAPAPVLAAIAAHEDSRTRGDYPDADRRRSSFDGLRVDDQRSGVLVARADRRLARRQRRTIASSRELDDRTGELATRNWTIAVAAREWPDDVERCVRSVVRFAPADAEVLVLDQGSSDRSAARMDRLESGDRVRIIHADRDLGEGAGRNALLRIARGKQVLQLDPSVELLGDLFTELEAALRSGAGIAGPWGLRTKDLRHFDEVTEGVCDAVQGYCQATTRETLLAIGGFDERYRFYRNLDIAVSFAVRERGQRAMAVGVAHAVRHVHRAWEALPEEERDKRSRKNHDRMYKRFHPIRTSA
jgi:cysteinyl-tRNA synthetase